jgi:hypothetical protein
MVLVLLALLLSEQASMEEAVFRLYAAKERSSLRTEHVNCVHHSGKLILMAAHVLKLDVHTERDSSLRVSASHVKHILELFMTERHVDQRFAMIDKCSYQMVLVKIALTTKEPWARIREAVEGLFAIQDKFFLLMEGVPTATLTQEHLLIN